MSLPLPRTPRTIDFKISALCERLVRSQCPIYLETEAIAGMIVNECYKNVAKVITEKGGAMQCGWRIWETLPEVMIEAEFHAVWADPEGKYHDITPKLLPSIDQILFLPDNGMSYQGRQIDNVRVPLVNDPLLHQFVENEEKYFKVMNSGELADYHGEVEATPEMKHLLMRKIQIFSDIVKKYYELI